MATLNTIWNISIASIRETQSALNITANNVSNANTTGYTRQVADWQESTTYQAVGITFGTGGYVAKAVSQRDSVLAARLDQQTSVAAEASARLDALEGVETIFKVSTSTSSTTGDLSTAMTDFFNSFSTLEGDPSNSSNRTDIISKADTLAQDFASTATNLTNQQTSVDNSATSLVSQINALTASIAKLNGEIQSAGDNTDTSMLQDQRETNLKSLAALVGTSEIKTTNDNGLIVTTTSGAVLVSGADSYQMTTSKNATTHLTDFYVNGVNATSGLTGGGGQLGGLLTVRDQDIPQMMSKLNSLAKGVADQINTLNTSGYTVSGASGSALFTYTAGSEAATLKLATGVTGASIGASGSATASGDGSNATAMSKVISSTALTGLGGLNPIDYYAAFVGAVGSLVSQVKTSSTAQSTALSQLQTQRDSLSAVNLDEEASSMLVYQRSYQAASKVFSIINDLMGSAINLGSSTTV